MKAEENKYERITSLLKRSDPVLADPEAMAESVIRRLQEEKSKVSFPELIFDYIFGWVYIGWVRKSMIAVTLMIFLLFGWQQALILKRIDDLSGQRMQSSTISGTQMPDDLASKMLLYRITGRKISDETLTISEKEIDRMISSLKKLQIKYKDLILLIENDPKLKKYIEDKILDSERDKI